MTDKMDFKQPFGRTSHGEGQPRKSDLECVFFQNGLYYDANGDLVKNDHNAAVLESRKPVEAPKATSDGNASQLPDLSKESDETIFRMALNLFNRLAKQGDTPDYEPDVGAREENLSFLATHS